MPDHQIISDPKDRKVCLSLERKTLAQVLMEAERVYLEHVLSVSGGNRTAAAKLAGVSNTTLRDKISRHTVQTQVSLT